ncbi:unnamed protein product [Lactuca virosa]|uniref:Uncharacterized protein n=1 Tax=Lactuca virosa TaxID=75947 RepID=A0AAU9PI04_9ASTR|nr:unnamed protein product [Lactuca virosa]
MLEGVILDREIGNLVNVTWSPLRLPCFGSDVFSFEHLLGDSSSPPEIIPLPHVPSSAGVGSSINSSLSRKRKRTLTPYQFEDFLREEVKFFLWILTLRDRYLSVEVNLWAADSMKLDGEEVLMKEGGMYVELVEQHRAVIGMVVVLENLRALLEADYKRCLWENEVLRAQLSTKLS